MTDIASPSIDLRARSVGELLDLTFSLYRAHFGTFIAITLVVMGPLMALTMIGNSASIVQIVSPLGMTEYDEAAVTSTVTTMLGASLVSLCAGSLAILLGVFTPWMGGALTHNVIERILGRAPAWRDSYRATLPRWGALWAASAIRTLVLIACALPAGVGLYGSLFAALLGIGATSSDSMAGLALTAGLTAICLPLTVAGVVVGAWLWVGWSLSEPAIVGEGADAVRSIGRSYALTNGFRWRLFGRLLVFWLMLFFVVQLPVLGLNLLVFAGVAGAAESGDASTLTVLGFVGSLIFGVIGSVLVTPLNVIYVTVNYLDLRVRKEHLDLQLRAAQLASPVPADTTQMDRPAPGFGLPAGVEPVPQPAPQSAPQSAPQPATQLAPAETAAPARMPLHDAAPIDPAMPPGQRISLLFNRIRAQGPSAELLNELGLAYQQIGDYDGALDALNRARQLEPADPDIAYNLAILHRDRNNLGEARRMMAEYLRLEPDAAERQRVLDNPRLRNLLPVQNSPAS